MGEARKPAVAYGRGDAFQHALPAQSPLRAIAGIERVSHSIQWGRDDHSQPRRARLSGTDVDLDLVGDCDQRHRNLTPIPVISQSARPSSFLFKAFLSAKE